MSVQDYWQRQRADVDKHAKELALVPEMPPQRHSEVSVLLVRRCHCKVLGREAHQEKRERQKKAVDEATLSECPGQRQQAGADHSIPNREHNSQAAVLPALVDVSRHPHHDHVICGDDVHGHLEKVVVLQLGEVSLIAVFVVEREFFTLFTRRIDALRVALGEQPGTVVEIGFLRRRRDCLHVCETQLSALVPQRIDVLEAQLVCLTLNMFALQRLDICVARFGRTSDPAGNSVVHWRLFSQVLLLAVV